MARRKKASPRRRSPKTINAANLLESYLIANVATQTMFQANPIQFVSGWSRNSGGNLQYRAGRDGATVLTLPEIISGINVGNFTGASPTVASIVKYNLTANNSENVGKLVAGVVGIPIAFRVGSKLLRKPRAQVNKLIRMTGLGVRV